MSQDQGQFRVPDATAQGTMRTGMLALLAAKDFCMSTTDAIAHQAVPRPAKMNSKISPQPQKLQVQHCAHSVPGASARSPTEAGYRSHIRLARKCDSPTHSTAAMWNSAALRCPVKHT